jgi:DNA-binding LacI/PurR family transcriptional regulator/DNA-binding transcriptional regulator YhcF (GntR family)
MRTAHKQQTIILELKRRIVGGEWPPLHRVPTRLELKKEFQTSLATVQYAVSTLVEEGFLQPRGKLGTFVRENPPHLADLALVLGRKRSRLSEGLAREAARLREKTGAEIKVYHDLEPHMDNPGHSRLLKDCRERRLAGLVLDAPAETLLHHSVLESGIPVAMVAITSGEAAGKSISSVRLNFTGLLRQSLEKLKSNGASRLGMLVRPNMDPGRMSAVVALAGTLGLVLEARHILCVPAQHPHWARNAIHAVMSGAVNTRPDALFIGDERFASDVAAALIELGIAIPRDLHVVAQCEFPARDRSPLPFHRIGFDVREVLGAALGVLRTATGNREETAPDSVAVQPVWEDQVAVVPKVETGQGMDGF